MKRSESNETAGPETSMARRQVAEVLSDYVPQFGTDEQRERWLSTAREMAAEVDPPTAETCKAVVRSANMFLCWGDEEGHVDPQHPERLFTDRMIDVWKKQVLNPSEWTVRTRARYRSGARRVMLAVNPAGERPTFREKRPDVQPPMTDPEINAQTDGAHVLGTIDRHRVMCTIYGILGGGLEPPDLYVVRGVDFVRIGDRSALDVPETTQRAPRRVWIRNEWIEPLAYSAARLGEHTFVPGDAHRRSGVVKLAEKLPSDAPRLSSARLRGRWIVDLLNDGVPVDVIAKAADLSSMTSIQNYLPWVDERDDDEWVALLLGDEA